MRAVSLNCVSLYSVTMRKYIPGFVCDWHFRLMVSLRSIRHKKSFDICAPHDVATAEDIALIKNTLDM